MLCVGFDRSYVSSHDGWKEAREYYDKRFSIGEVKITQFDRQEKAFRSVGWAPEDYQVFIKGFYENPSFSLENLKRLDDLLPADPGVKWDLIMGLSQNNVVQFLLVGLLVCVALNGIGGGGSWGPVVWALFLDILLLCLNKIVARVFWPQIFLSILILLFLLPAKGIPLAAPFDRRSLKLALVLLLFFFASRTLSADYLSNRPGPQVRQAILDSMKALSPRQDQLFIITGSSFPFSGFPIFESDDSMKDFRALWMWWFEKTPYGDERLAQFHIRDFLKDTVDRPDIFWLISDPPGPLEDYFAKRGRSQVVRKQVFHGYFDVFQLITKKAGGKESF